MTAEEKDNSSVTFSADTKKEEANGNVAASMEEGIPTAKSNGSSLIQRQTSSRLSAISRKYDVDGDGKLDEAEQAMRDMDKEGRGFLTNDKVYSIFQQQLRMQKQLLLAKRLLIFFAMMLIILAVANIGVAFAAARLAKDTTADTENKVLVVSDTGDVIATNNHADVFGMQTSIDTRRDLLDGDGTTTATATYVSRQHAQAMFAECAKSGISVNLVRTWDGYPNTQDYITLCPAVSYNQVGNSGKYTYVLTTGMIGANHIIDIDCTGNADPCLVTGTGLQQVAGEACVYDSDCENGSTCDGVTNTSPGTCKWPIGWGCWTDEECTTDTCYFRQTRAAGTCVCNPSTNEGCVAPETCASVDEQYNAQGLVDAGPGCYLPLNAPCTEGYECLTGVCDSVCVCNSRNYGCADDGETCVNGVCQASTSTNGQCPSVPDGASCFAVDEPVKCGDCCYTNPCTALAANAAFIDSACTAVSSLDTECPDGVLG